MVHMNVVLKKSEVTGGMPLKGAGAKVLALPAPKRPPLAARIASHASAIAARVVPPIIVIALTLMVWEILCSKQGASLPPPSQVVAETWELITDPFYDRGGIDR
jgi:nitrate/nitrite transport system permease protein